MCSSCPQMQHVEGGGRQEPIAMLPFLTSPLCRYGLALASGLGPLPVPASCETRLPVCNQERRARARRLIPAWILFLWVAEQCFPLIITHWHFSLIFTSDLFLFVIVFFFSSSFLHYYSQEIINKSKRRIQMQIHRALVGDLRFQMPTSSNSPALYTDYGLVACFNGQIIT